MAKTTVSRNDASAVKVVPTMEAGKVLTLSEIEKLPIREQKAALKAYQKANLSKSNTGVSQEVLNQIIALRAESKARRAEIVAMLAPISAEYDAKCKALGGSLKGPLPKVV